LAKQAGLSALTDRQLFCYPKQSEFFEVTQNSRQHARSERATNNCFASSNQPPHGRTSHVVTDSQQLSNASSPFAIKYR
jgi:hypothetical protein